MGARYHRPAHHQLALRGAAAHWTLRPRDADLHPRRGAAAGRLRDGHARLEGVRRSRHLRRTAAGQPDPPPGQGWREAGYPGVTGITKRLLEHWRDPEETRLPPVLLLPAGGHRDPDLADRGARSRAAGHRSIPGDGGPFMRLCAKMATGSGKTIVMAMLIAWQVLNKVTYPQDTRFSKNVFVVAPGPDGQEPACRSRCPPVRAITTTSSTSCPPALHGPPAPGRVLVRNWHALNWETRGADSPRSEAWTSAAPRATRPTSARCWARWPTPGTSWSSTTRRTMPGACPRSRRSRGVSKEDIEEATKWIGGLDRIHRARGILGLLRLLGHALRALGQAEHRGGAVRAGSSATSA